MGQVAVHAALVVVVHGGGGYGRGRGGRVVAVGGIPHVHEGGERRRRRGGGGNQVGGGRAAHVRHQGGAARRRCRRCRRVVRQDVVRGGLHRLAVSVQGGVAVVTVDVVVAVAPSPYQSSVSPSVPSPLHTVERV